MRFLKFIVFVFVFAAFLILTSCKVSQKTEDKKKAQENSESQNQTYRSSNTRKVDLIHTLLKVGFDWEKQHLIASAELTLKPYFYSIESLVLDAKGMEIKSISLLNSDGKSSVLKYKYDSLQITIDLPKKYNKNETFKVLIDYIAKPNELKSQGSSAIKDDKGLYFINPLNKDEVKPKQIWTQGETEAASCWFPTIDSPNERCTQEIYITVPNNFKTLSNGLLMNSTPLENGKRTDYWKQDLAHAPYLFMMAIGEYTIIKDTWEGIPISYYVEPKDSMDALLNFGNTKQMLSFFSDKLGVKYPWDKYAQVMVRDYVSGAMENTSATVFGKFVFRNQQQLIDENHEDIIAHELFHQWFGDYVTCESWSNLALNESFATYGEYLWMEHKYGKTRADKHLYQDLIRYLSDQPYKEIIRFKYDDKEDMFDDHSYEKGGLILHQLRDVVGDDAFFASLKLYLEKNALKSVEIHNLRLAFEEVTGLDLNWFFNQWFLKKGHPILQVDYKIQSDSLIVDLTQTQNLKQFPVFKLPLSIDVYEAGKPTRHDVVLEKEKETLIFKVSGSVDFITVDSKNILCGEIINKLTPEQALLKFSTAKLFRDKIYAIKSIKEDTTLTSWQLLQLAVKDTLPTFRTIGISYLGKTKESKTDDYKELLVNLSIKDLSSDVRSTAIYLLAKYFPTDSLLIPIYKEALEDSSYLVKIEAITALHSIKREDALLRSVNLEKEDDEELIFTLCDLYTDIKDEGKVNYYKWAISHTEGHYKIEILDLFTSYLKNKSHNVVWKCIKTLKEITIFDNDKSIREAAGLAVHKLHKQHLLSIEDIKKDIKDQEKSSKGTSYDLKMLKEKLVELEEKEKEILVIIKEIISSEKNLTVIEAWKLEGFEDKI